MKGTTRRDWLTAGLGLLRDGGEAALTIEQLCAAVKRTKGSFYHHFTDIAAYHEALLMLWAESHTELAIQEADGSPGGDRRHRLYRSVGKLDLGVERAVHAWAVRSKMAFKVVQGVHARRIEYLAQLRPGDKNALAKAELEYAALIGSLHLYPSDPHARARIMMNATGAKKEQR